MSNADARQTAFAAELPLASTTLLRALYDLIIRETCRLEDEIIGAPSTSA
ncbi:MAG TPA: hypothetical protein VF503_12340 [Sphingobium sp.]